MKKTIQANKRNSTVIAVISAVAIITLLIIAVFYQTQKADNETLETVKFSLDYQTYASVSELTKDTDVVVFATVADDGKTVAGPSVGKTADGKEAPTIPSTEFTVKVEKVSKGDISVGSNMVVVLTGGKIDGRNYVAEDMPWLTKGDEVLLYLHKGDDGKFYPMAGGGAIAMQKDGDVDKYVLPREVSSSDEEFEVTEK